MGRRQKNTSTLQIQTAAFLPMLCSRPSIKNVTIPKSQSLSLQDQEDDDPLSPKISCIGQVKRNNRITNLPTAAKLAITTSKRHNHNHYFKLRRLFSGTTLSLTLSKPSKITPRRSQESAKKSKGSKIDERNKGFVLDVVDMDPPLPVVKKKQNGEEKAPPPENLWKRRSGGLELGSLQIQQIQDRTRHQMQLITSV
ncbi:PREDICTED: uncharacterized protein LOC104806807 [Tarenaya hassleriana]|uniref:uncharacterized protein LOC104806807 n=1 Tax=Tarenaya hassleriana TaxID=28532 RepID=UPI00053C22A5|nr:PREDICTED: uncharacterized protein LOC104806807 [Tarenaya hassleriana]